MGNAIEHTVKFVIGRASMENANQLATYVFGVNMENVINRIAKSVEVLHYAAAVGVIQQETKSMMVIVFLVL
jgi:hypothetical protein